MKLIESESGYIEDVRPEYVANSMNDVEILRVTSTNVIARGRRYGRLWLLKGLRPEMRESTTMRKQLMKEFEIHSRLSHPGIAQVIGLEEVEGLGTCIVEEWIEGKNLSQLISEGALSKADRRRIMREIIKAAAYMHSKGVVHRDLKPANIMIRDAGGQAAVVDFGLADSDDYLELKQAAGTEGFISPEQRQAGGAVTSDDVYSLGATMLELCPEYRSVAMKCTGPLDKRPVDGRALIGALDRRDRRPRIIGAVAAAILLAIVGVLGFIHIRALTVTARDAEKRVAAISEESQRNAELASRLSDSLQIVSGRMKEAETELKRVDDYKNLLETARTTGQSKLDAILKRYDKVFSQLSPEKSDQFNDKMLLLLKELRDATDGYCASSLPDGLSESDRRQIKLDLYNYYTITMSEYHKQWIKKIHPELQMNL